VLLSLLAAGIVSASADRDTPIQEVIDGEARWDGEVNIDGVVIVTGSGTLTIEPGTRVVFMPRDDDDDGIGDSELRIEGSIRVSGTEKDPVWFTSGADTPETADWKFVMINHARSAEVEHAVFEYAFSGLQIHYTRGVFRNLVCRNNVDGFRFSTAPVTLENSLVTGNVNGIRFEERGAGARILGNIVSGNEVGLFAVTRCSGLSVFSGNSFVNNSDYNVKMGHRQTDDLPVPGNWWGTRDKDIIENSFFDGRQERTLGRVLFEPYLAEKPKDN
jgi:hypothetical protein